MGRVFRFLFPFAVIGLFAVLLLAMSGSWLIARKVIAMLILPTGAIWLALLGLTLWPGLKRWHRIVLGGLWILYTLAGSPYLGVALLQPLEAPFFETENSEQKLDALVLLGGGTVRSPGGHPALGTHGDRVLRPTMLYNRGLVKTLVTTGRSVTESGEDRLLSRETSLIWQDLGVPAEAIVELSEPRNTAEELAAVAGLLRDRPDWKTVGLCSSALHLRRALKESEAQGLDLIPVPSDFRSMPLVPTPLYAIPQGRGFRDVQTALWEYLGGWF
ncbi:MAG: YdcF family protein [Verrucomicrobiales bacterium]